MKSPKRLFNLIPNITVKKGPLLRGLNKAGDIMGRPMENRLIMGATAIATQPYIDEHNKRVDKDTARTAKNRTIGKIIAGTSVGCLVRGLVYKLIDKTMVMDISADRLNNILTPRNSFVPGCRTRKNRMRNYKTTIATIISLVAMLGTNVLIDMPLTNMISNYLNRRDAKKTKKQNSDITQQQNYKILSNANDKIKQAFKTKGYMQ